MRENFSQILRKKKKKKKKRKFGRFEKCFTWRTSLVFTISQVFYLRGDFFGKFLISFFWDCFLVYFHLFINSWDDDYMCKIKANQFRKITLRGGGELGLWKTFPNTTNLNISKSKNKEIDIEKSNTRFYSGSTLFAYVHSPQVPTKGFIILEASTKLLIIYTWILTLMGFTRFLQVYLNLKL